MNVKPNATTIEPSQETRRSFDSTLTGLRGGMEAAAAGFAQTQSQMGVLFERAGRALAEMAAFNQATLEACVTSGQILAQGHRDLYLQATEAARAAVAESVSALQAAAGVRSVREGLELQARLVRSGVERGLTETTRFTHASMALTEQVVAPLAARVAAAEEKLKSLA